MRVMRRQLTSTSSSRRRRRRQRRKNGEEICINHFLFHNDSNSENQKLNITKESILISRFFFDFSIQSYQKSIKD